MSELRVIHAGFGADAVPYLDALADQRRLHEARAAGEIPDTVLLLEHPAVYTAGKRTEAWEKPLGGRAPVIDVDRGGKITWHGPGQLTGYTIVKLPEPMDVIAYVRRMEGMLIDVCAELGVPAARVEGPNHSGVWVLADERGPNRKIAAIGLRVSRGVVMHGFNFNCDCDLSWFDTFVPCGIADAGVTSLSKELGRDVTVTEVVPVIERHLPTLLDIPALLA